jgi:hypothetical protein
VDQGITRSETRKNRANWANAMRSPLSSSLKLQPAQPDILNLWPVATAPGNPVDAAAWEALRLQPQNAEAQNNLAQFCFSRATPMVPSPRFAPR